ncbi:MAG: hypothetical protein J6U51_07405 [Bacteroidales bacterium]|nr:hypothetical protein [Bacteroidales bacterium]
MKKYFLSIVALAGMLFATSCQESLVEPQMEGPTTFTVQVPDAMGTKAIGDASIIDRLYVAVYENFDENGGAFPTTAIYKTNVPVLGGAATVTLNLIQGQKYDIVFWAQNENENSYVKTGDELLSIPMNNSFHNNEKGAAFFHFEPNFEAKGTAKDIRLKRPFAQLNLGTTEGSLKTDAGEFKLKRSKITVSTVAEAFNTINGVGETEVAGQSYEADIEFTQDLTVAGQDYTYVSMDYLPIPSGSKLLVNIEALIVIEDESGATKEISHSFTSVPVQENYRTNIVGNLISSSTDFNVVVDAEFEGELPETDLEKLQFVAANGGEVILQDDVELTESLLITAGVTKSQAESSIPVVIDLNGHKIFQVKSQTGAYSMIDNRGNLTIKDSRSTGLVKYSDIGNGGEYASNTIANSGVLVIEGGNFVNESSSNVATNGYPHVIDNSGRLVINGGTFTNAANYSTMRIWCTTDDDTEVIINGGTFNGSIDFQTPNASANKGILTIKGGTFNADDYTGSAVRLLGFGVDVDEMICNISGGTFNGLVKRNKYVSDEFNSQVFYISGGTFQNDPSEFVVEGYIIFKVSDNEYRVAVSDADAVVKNTNELNEAIAAGKKTIMLSAGEFGTILAKSNITYIGTYGAKVDCINLNGANNVTIKNITFDASTAVMGYDGRGTARQYANIITGDKNNNPSVGARNLVIDHCIFKGTFNDGGAAIAFTDRSRATGGSGDISIVNCTFQTSGGYYDIYGYYFGNSNYDDLIIEGNVFSSSIQGKPLFFASYQSSTPVQIVGNTFNYITSLTDAYYLTGNSGYNVSVNASNNTFAQ